MKRQQPEAHSSICCNMHLAKEIPNKQQKAGSSACTACTHSAAVALVAPSSGGAKHAGAKMWVGCKNAPPPP